MLGFGLGLSAIVAPSWGGYPELVVNGRFDTDLSGWTDASTAPSTVIWSAGIALWQTDGVAGGRIRQSVTTEIGKTYRLSRLGSANLAAGTTAGGNDLLSFSSTAVRTFVATSTTTWINIHDTANGDWADNVSLRRV